MRGTGAEREGAEKGKGKCHGDKGPSVLAARTLGKEVLSLPHPPQSTWDLPEGDQESGGSRRRGEVLAWSLGLPVSQPLGGPRPRAGARRAG